MTATPVRTAARTAAKALVDQLLIQGVAHAFCVPGESYLPVLDALRDSGVALTVCRQEGGMAMMAEAVGKTTGRPGVCFVTRGPGATNAAAGVHVAYQDSTPMILFVGQVRRRFRGRDAWQELDYKEVFGGIAKWATEIDDPDRVSEIVARAFHVAMSGRPGPVVVALPTDVLSLPSTAADAPRVEAPETAPGAADMAALAALLAAAQRPLLLLGGSRWDEAACAAAQRFAERFDLPVATSHRRTGLFDPRHDAYAGELGLSPNPKLIQRIKTSDLLLLVGGRLGDVPSQGYSLIDIPTPQVSLVHVFPDAEELGRVYQPRLAIHASPSAFAAALDALAPPTEIPWRGERAAARADYLAWSEVPTPQPGAVNLGEIVVWLRDHLPADAILCNGAGNYAAWINRYYRTRGLTGHVAPTSGSMGYGVPAAIAMKRLHPERPVVALTGDGDFLMTGQEFAVAVQYGLPIVVLVADNGIYGTIRMHQERDFPGRVSGTDLVNPDFAAYARAFGGFGATVETTADFEAAFRAAEASGLPAILHLKIDPEAIMPGTTLTQIREAALARG
jgi:acetolactate synthase-1/2/3 large subunit